MATSTRRSFAWLSAFLLAAPALPALAQTRVAVSADGAAVPAAAVAGAAAPGMGAGTGVAPISFAAPSLAAVPSAPSAAISRPAESGAVAAGPAASVAVPALGASPAVSRAALASLPVLTSPVEAAAAPARAAVAVAHRVAAHETAAASISASRPETAREAAALALVAGETAGWETRSAQTLGAAPVLGAASEGTGPLARPTARTAAPEPAAPAPSKVKAVVKWAWPIALLTALVTALDFGTKLFATKHLFTVFHEVAWRTPFLMAIIPYIIFTAYKARSSLPNDHKVWHWSPKQLRNGRFGFFQDGVSGMTAMVKDHPSLRWAQRLYDVSIALMVGGMLGNGIDALRLGGALDWIPLGRSLMNLADVSLLCGLAFFQLGTSFFIKAGMAHKAGKPLFFSTASFLGLPLAGVFIAWAFGSAQGGGALDLAMKNVGFLYLMGFSMLVGFSRFLAATVLNRFVSRFVAEEGAKAR